MKRILSKAAAAALMVLLLAGCGEDRPSDKVAEPVVRKLAETDLADGLEIVDFQRSNGQLDPDSANRYRVTYTYKLQLAKPYGEVILGLARGLNEELQQSAARQAQSDMDFGALQDGVNLMQSVMVASQWINAQGDGFAPRRDAMLAACAPCRAFWESADAPEQAELRRVSFIVAWNHLEQMQFADDFRVGDGVERHAWHNFEKTEKGWLPSN